MASWFLKQDTSHKQPLPAPGCFLSTERASYIHGRGDWVAPWAKLEDVKNNKKNHYPCRKSKPVSSFRPASSLVPIPQDVTLLLTEWFPRQNLSIYPTVRRIFLFPLRFNHRNTNTSTSQSSLSLWPKKVFFDYRNGRKALGTRSGLFVESSKVLN